MRKIVEEIKKGEGKKLEFKETLSENSSSFLKTVVAFANGAGGKVIFGVKSKTREIVGIPDDEVVELSERIENMIYEKCYPTIIPEIYVERVNGKNLLVVEIYPGHQKPYFLKKKGKPADVYIRIGASTRRAPEEIIRSLERERLNIGFDEEILYDAPFNEKELEKLIKDLEIFTGRRVNRKDLYNFKIIKKERGKDYLTVGGALLLGRNDIFEFARISCARFKGKTPSSMEFIDLKECSGPIYEQVKCAIKFAMMYIEKSGKISGIKRYDEYLIPLEALREAVINAVVHRDYSITGSDIKLAIFDDRVEITSPGGLPGNLDVELIKEGRSEIRNRVIARFFKEIGYIEQWGTGIQRIIDSCRKQGLKEPEFIDDTRFFKVILYKLSKGKVPESAGKVPKSAGKVPESIPGIDAIMRHLKNYGYIRRKDVETLLSIKERRAREILKQLVDEGVLHPVGSGKRRIYKLASENDRV